MPRRLRVEFRDPSDSRAGSASALYAITLDGRERLVFRVPGTIELHDISREGHVLLTRMTYRTLTGPDRHRCGVASVSSVLVMPDGGSVAYTYELTLSELYLGEGLK